MDLRLFVTWLFLIVASPAWANPALCAEVYRDQEFLAESVNAQPVVMVVENTFKTYRGLLEYVDLLPTSFLSTLKSISNRHRASVWMDFGAGEGNALFQMRNLNRNRYDEVELEKEASYDRLADYFNTTALVDRPRGIGITFRRDEIPGGQEAWTTPGLKMKEGFFEMMTFKNEERFDLGTDVFGVFEYTTRLDLALAKAISLMKPGAKLYIYSGSKYRISHMSMEKDEVELLNMTKVNIRDWYKRIKGDVSVKFEESENDMRLSTVITRTGDGIVRIPELEPIETNLPLQPEKPRSRRAFAETGDFIEVRFDVGIERRLLGSPFPF